MPNGRPATSRSPLGVPKRTWIDLLYAGGAAAGFLAPPGADPQADLTNWRSATLREPFGPEVSGIAHTLTTYIGGAAGLRGSEPAPLMIENGWTDELFPADEALRIGAGATRPKLLLGDLGHGWAHNPPAIDRRSTTSAPTSSASTCSPSGRASRPCRPTSRRSSRPAPRPPSGAASAARRWPRCSAARSCCAPHAPSA